MKIAMRILSWIALAATLVLPATYLAGGVSLDFMKLGLLAATVAWFVATPVWMERGEVVAAPQYD
jgi:hypothetical protein